MAAPTFVNQGALVAVASAATLTPGLPASRVNNNIMISVCLVAATGKTVTTATAGWTIGDSINSGNVSGAWAWRLVDGTEAAPVWTWTGNAKCAAYILQYTGNATVSPINTSNKASGNSSTTETVAALTTSADQCVIIDCLSADSAQNPPVPSDYTSRVLNNNSNISVRVADGTALGAGTTTAVSITISSANWTSFGIAVLGSGSGANSERATQVVQQALESYTNATNARATQVVQQALESYTNPTSARATQVVIQVLRSVVDASGGASYSQIIE
jgi:hypothetical protein